MALPSLFHPILNIILIPGGTITWSMMLKSKEDLTTRKIISVLAISKASSKREILVSLSLLQQTISLLLTSGKLMNSIKGQ